MLRRLSLRTRLVLGVIVLAALGLAIADVVTYTSLRSFLLQRTDVSLDAAHVGVEHALFQQGPGPPQGDALTAAAPGDYIEVRTLSGKVVAKGAVPQFQQQSIPAPPSLPAKIAIPGVANSGRDRTRYFTVGSVDGDDRYRVRASIEPSAQNYVLIIATPLEEVDNTLSRLVLIELLVTGGVLAALAGLGLWVVRLGLRPLSAIESTASAIAAGDLSRRVERAEQRTEVGRLGLALNAMLGQIETAFKAREASERRLRRFVADASHELRTPLAAIRAYAELFTRGADRRPEDLARSMGGITRESERMSVLVEDLLLLARLDEGRPLEREPVALGELVGEAVETARAVDPDRPIELSVEPLTVLGDRDRLRQIVDNLLGNARAHTPASAPVKVSVARRDGSAVVEVADSGPGLAPDELERVFERFYRADESRSRTSGGVGLGLSIVAAVAQAHGGSVSAESEPGSGAVFRIELPLDDGSSSEPYGAS
ncbi:MAG TPA: HAMP domain-containing sensor histidine kinase [Gaiellaceae bacterium]|nr:HAMP domain-containing sensor histidine kinase [Gaiellaceae bacterium]